MLETMTAFVMAEHMGGVTFDPPIGPPGYARMLAPDRRPHRTSDGYICILPYTHLERDEPASAPDDVVEGRPIREWAILPVALSRAIDKPRVDLLQPLPGKAEPSHRLGTHIMHQDVAPPRAPPKSAPLRVV
jgi:hypothetical protein